MSDCDTFQHLIPRPIRLHIPHRRRLEFPLSMPRVEHIPQPYILRGITYNPADLIPMLEHLIAYMASDEAVGACDKDAGTAGDGRVGGFG